jgi:predicted phosphate transport protein (TIGR00153 family)
MGMRFRLIPRNEDFYLQFIALAAQLRIGGGLLEEMLARDPAIWDKAEEIKEVEHKCDHLTHQIISRLNTTFVTPIDREDIHALAKSLDDVMDAIDASARFVRLYKIGTVRYGARELAHVVSLSVDQVRLALEALEKRAGVAQRAVEINRLENEADRIHEESLRRLFEEERDPVMIIKWKEILDFLEEATDRCEDVANLLEGVVVKNA